MRLSSASGPHTWHQIVAAILLAPCCPGQTTPPIRPAKDEFAPPTPRQVGWDPGGGAHVFLWRGTERDDAAVADITRVPVVLTQQEYVWARPSLRSDATDRFLVHRVKSTEEAVPFTFSFCSPVKARGAMGLGVLLNTSDGRTYLWWNNSAGELYVVEVRGPNDEAVVVSRFLKAWADVQSSPPSARQQDRRRVVLPVMAQKTGAPDVGRWPHYGLIDYVCQVDLRDLLGPSLSRNSVSTFSDAVTVRVRGLRHRKDGRYAMELLSLGDEMLFLVIGKGRRWQLADHITLDPE